MSERKFKIKATMLTDLEVVLTESELQARGVDTSSLQGLHEGVRFNEAVDGSEMTEVPNSGDWVWGDIVEVTEGGE